MTPEGLEPSTLRLKAGCSSLGYGACRHIKAFAIYTSLLFTLHIFRFSFLFFCFLFFYFFLFFCFWKEILLFLVVAVGFEPTKLNAEDLESSPFDRSGTLLLRPVGLEPTTLRLKAGCSSLELWSL